MPQWAPVIGLYWKLMLTLAKHAKTRLRILMNRRPDLLCHCLSAKWTNSCFCRHIRQLPSMLLSSIEILSISWLVLIHGSSLQSWIKLRNFQLSFSYIDSKHVLSVSKSYYHHDGAALPCYSSYIYVSIAFTWNVAKGKRQAAANETSPTLIIICLSLSLFSKVAWLSCT